MNLRSHSYHFGPEVFHLFRAVEFSATARNIKEVHPKGLGDHAVAFARDSSKEYYGAIIGNHTGNILEVPCQEVWPRWQYNDGRLVEDALVHEVEWISKTPSGRAEIVWVPKTFLTKPCNQQGLGSEEETKRVYMYVLHQLMK
jgi:hypothetical protein